VLSRVGSEWLVGDKETARVSERAGACLLLQRAVAGQRRRSVRDATADRRRGDFYSRKFAKNASLQELIRMGGVPKDIEDGETSGYKLR